jgi:hypothetical protein
VAPTFLPPLETLLELNFWVGFLGQLAIVPAFQGRPGNLAFTASV